MANDESPVDAAVQAPPEDRAPRADASAEPEAASASSRRRTTRTRPTRAKSESVGRIEVPPRSAEPAPAPRRAGRPRKTTATDPAETSSNPVVEIADSGHIPAAANPAPPPPTMTIERGAPGRPREGPAPRTLGSGSFSLTYTVSSIRSTRQQGTGSSAGARNGSPVRRLKHA